ncbi:hypothetical protein CEXT_63861 [Caerostris extrusa]|uniref:Uncharacterized protein n=1 Tax=Caerostris extrusa TaxID=172846 RepID=A0AAV4P3K4_CAEEX|nr:hypothetical protein CEXT_63861 [Caerostris extrusa]
MNSLISGLKKNYISPPLQMVDIYSILCELLGIEPLPNNGTKASQKESLLFRTLLQTDLHNPAYYRLQLEFVSFFTHVCITISRV